MHVSRLCERLQASAGARTTHLAQSPSPTQCTAAPQSPPGPPERPVPTHPLTLPGLTPMARTFLNWML